MRPSIIARTLPVSPQATTVTYRCRCRIDIFVHQQHTARSVAATVRYPLGVGSHQTHDPMPTHPVMAGRRPSRHPPGVLHKPLSEPPTQAGLELGMVLEVTFLTVPAPEPSATPHQGRPAGRSPPSHGSASLAGPTPCGSGTHSADTSTTPGPIPAGPQPFSKDFTPPTHVFAQGLLIGTRRQPATAFFDTLTTG